ncbi:MAG: HepT-like ribonuclease domain-containing protein [Cyanobacteria bacterium P01_F01_bin.143]
MIDNSNKAIDFVSDISREDFDCDEKLRLAVTHLLQIIGEAARRISPEFRATQPQIPWKAIVGMRSKVVHNYLNVDEDIVWETAKNDFAPLVSELEKILRENSK